MKAVAALLTVSLCLFGMVAEPSAQPVANASFEVADEANPDVPKDWRVIGTPSAISLDRSQKHSGAQSVRIERSEQFVGLSQSIDATTWRGKPAIVRAWFKSKDLEPGSAGVWFRGDKASQRTFFVHSYVKPLPRDGDWVVREAIMLVPADTERLVFGMGTDASGTLWVDSIELSEFAPSVAPALSEQARTYLDEAIQKIRAAAMNADVPDWNGLTPLLYRVADGAVATSDTYPAITLALQSLRDNHSFFRPPQTARALTENTTIDNFNLNSQSMGAVGYVMIPGYAGGTPARNTAFADEVQRRIVTLAESKPCGWIVDLRQNTGGNMWPMISGLAPLLGDSEELGSFENKGQKSPWRLKQGVSGGAEWNAATPTAHHAVDGGDKAPIAVLIGPKTSSSGEATLVSFLGRPSTRTFGQPTFGVSTANLGIKLSDGAMIFITTSKFADRTGKVYGEKIAPDELVDAPALSDPGKDLVVRAATGWLESRPECKSRTQ